MRRMTYTAVLAVLAMISTGCVWMARASTDGTGTQNYRSTYIEDISANGRYVLVETDQPLLAIDTNGFDDLYRKDMVTGAVVLVSMGGTATIADWPTRDGVISDDGNVVAFYTRAANLVPNDTNGEDDVFVRDIAAQTTTRVSVTDTGAQATDDVRHPAISGDGQVVAFETGAPMVAGETGIRLDVFRHDLATSTTSKVSESAAGVAGDGHSTNASVNFDGSLIAFTSQAENLMPGDANGFSDVYVKAATGAVFRVSTPSGGGDTNGDSSKPSISGNGLIVAFQSDATDLGPTDTNGVTDVYVKTATGDVILASVADDGSTLTGRSIFAEASNDGSLVLFETEAPELGASSSLRLAAIRDGVNESTTVVGRTETGAVTPSGLAEMSGDGNYVGWHSQQIDVITPDLNGVVYDVFIRWWSDPSITSVTPSQVPDGNTTAMTITGAGFRPGAVTTVAVPGSYASVDNVVVVDDETITFDLRIDLGAPLIARPVFVTQFGTGPGLATGSSVTCAGCVTIIT